MILYNVRIAFIRANFVVLDIKRMMYELEYFIYSACVADAGVKYSSLLIHFHLGYLPIYLYY